MPADAVWFCCQDHHTKSKWYPKPQEIIGDINEAVYERTLILRAIEEKLDELQSKTETETNKSNSQNTTITYQTIQKNTLQKNQTATKTTATTTNLSNDSKKQTYLKR